MINIAELGLGVPSVCRLSRLKWVAIILLKAAFSAPMRNFTKMHPINVFVNVDINFQNIQWVFFGRIFYRLRQSHSTSF